MYFLIDKYSRNCETILVAEFLNIKGGSTNEENSYFHFHPYVACGTCHGNPPNAPHTPNANCGTCHPDADAAGNITDHTRHIDGVVETPNGAHFTECQPDYPRDEKFQREYAATAKDDDAWKAFRAKYLDVSEADYQKAVAS